MNLISERLKQLEIGAPVTFGSMAVFPLLNGGGGDPGYLTLDQALATGKAKVTEAQPGGIVERLLFQNDTEMPVLLLDGEELLGAQQNRIVNLTVLVAPKSQTVIPVSCVEEGRWSAVSAEFAPSPRAHHAQGRARKIEQVSESLREYGGAYSDQHAVWQELRDKSQRMGVSSPTGAMAAVFDQHQHGVEEYVRAFPAAPRQVGAVFAIGGEVLGLDCFDRQATLAALLPKLVRSWALDALEAPPTDRSPEVASAFGLLDLAADTKHASHRAVGLGEDLRLEGPGLAGGGLAWDGRLVHLALFRLREVSDDQPSERRSGMVAASRRRSLVAR